MTTKFTITRMVKTMMPMMKFPLITKLPNAWMTWPAASVPSCPRDKMRRVEARLRASRSMVAIRRTVGKAENSSGAWMNSAVIRISTEKVIEMASAKSRSSDGSGRMRTTRMAITPTASPMSLRLSSAPRSARRENRNGPSLRSAEVTTSVMPSACARRLRSRAAKECAAAVGPPARTKGKGAALASKTAPKGCPRRCGGNGLRTDLPWAKSAGCMVTAGLISPGFRGIWVAAQRQLAIRNQAWTPIAHDTDALAIRPLSFAVRYAPS